MDGGGRSTIAIWVVAAVLAVVAGMRLLGGAGGEPPAVSIDGPRAGTGTAAAVSGAGTGSAGAAGDAAAELYVHVAGAVRRPGLIRVPPGTRVATALERVGGPTRRADLTLVNLAAKVQDGQQIVVPVRGTAPGAGGAAGSAAAGSAGAAGASGAAGALPGAKIHLSTATLGQLDEIDGIGPTLAGRIIEYRDTHAGLRSIDELAEVEGIGEKRLATLRDALQP